MAYGTILADTLQSSTTGTPVVFKDGNGTQTGTLCRAWVNFNGTTSPGTIRASFNVGSVTKNGTGDYTVNFTNAMSDANYSACVGGNYAIGPGTYSNPYDAQIYKTYTASGFGIVTLSSGSAYDFEYVTASVFR